MTKISMLQKKAASITENKNIQQALVGYFCHLSNYIGDYSGATQEAACDLEPGQEDEFLIALKRMAISFEKDIVHIYNSGYMHGHNDTVDGVFVPICTEDFEEYHKDEVTELIEELNTPPYN